MRSAIVSGVVPGVAQVSYFPLTLFSIARRLSFLLVVKEVTNTRSLFNLASVTIQTLILSCEVAFISIDFFERVVYRDFQR